jgi:hypothetical protein
MSDNTRMSHRTHSAVLNRVLKAAGWFSAPSRVPHAACVVTKVALAVAVLLLSLPLWSAAQSATSFLTNGLVAYYPFHGNALDESGNGNDLTNYGATLGPDRFGTPNQAYYFDGSNFLGTTVSPLTQTDNWTMTAWVMPESVSPTPGFAVCAGYDSLYHGDGFAIAVYGGYGFWAFYPGVGYLQETSTPLSTNEWYHVAMERSSGTLGYYVNGELIANGEPITTVPDTPTSFEVGSGGIQRYFNGAVNDVRVYNIPLSALDVQALYNYEGFYPVILSPPTNAIVGVGTSASFSVFAEGAEPLAYQWEINGTNVANATNSTFIITTAQLADAGAYSVAISNGYGSITSSSALLIVAESPVIEEEPQNQMIVAGGSAMFTVIAAGSLPLTYRWTFNGTDIATATNSMLSLRDAQSAQGGAYNVIVSNRFGSIVSSNALLDVRLIEEILNNGLVAYYPFDGNANDESGNGNDLENYGATLCADRFGVTNKAYYFDGGTYLGSSVSPLSQVDNWTVTAWIKPASLSQNLGYAVCVGYDNGGSGDGFAMGISSVEEAWTGVVSDAPWAFFPGVGFVSEGSLFVSTNQWYQVAMVRNSGALLFYINGNVVTNGGLTTYVPLMPTSFEVGSGGSAQYFLGAVGDVRIYNRSLTEFEVQQLYNDEAFIPLILTQPSNVTASQGESISFVVEAEGAEPLNYQWKFGGTNIAHATNSVLAVPHAQFGDAGVYSVVISNGYGSITSSNALLNVVLSPVIQNQPQSEVILAGSSAIFSVTATSPSALTYQWIFNGTDIADATDSTLTITNAQPAQAGTYSVLVRNSDQSVTSTNAVLTVLTTQDILTNGLVAYYPFTGNAKDESGNGNDLTNDGATLCVDRFGGPSHAYYFNGSSFLGSSNSPLSQTDNWTVSAWIEPATLSQMNAYAVCVGYDNGGSGDGYALGISSGELWASFPGVGFIPGGYQFSSSNQWYHVVMVRSAATLMFYVNGNAVTNGSPTTDVPVTPTSFEVGSGGSDRYFEGAVNDVRVYNLPLTALEVQGLFDYEATNPFGPVIMSQPTSESVEIGTAGGFTVDATGPGPLSYQWRFNGANIAGATDSTWTFPDVQPAQIGTYSVIVGNSYGLVTSSNALLTIVNFPVIEVQPQSQIALSGDTVTFSVIASGAGLTYQWFMNDSPLEGQTGSALVLNDVSASNSAQYAVVVSNSVWAVASSLASLSVLSGAAVLNPLAFKSLGVFNPTTNVVVDVESGQMSGGATFTGINLTNNGTSLLAFTFSSFTLEGGLSITFTNEGGDDTAVAFLSKGDMTIGGVINANGQEYSPVPTIHGIGGPDGNGPASYGGEAGGIGNYPGSGFDQLPGNGGVANDVDLTLQFGGGSGGGTGSSGNNFQYYGPGGGGGGAFQIAALGSLTVTGTISVNGAGGSAALSPIDNDTGSGGGGSGGGLLVQAGNVTIGSNAALSANGGPGGPAITEGQYGPLCYSGGGGGGGRVVVLYNSAGMNYGSTTASGGSGGDSYYSAGTGAAGSVVFAQSSLIPALPGVSATLDSSRNFVMSWPASATNYVLETSATLGPGTVWKTVPGAVVSGNYFVMTNKTSGAAGFFRLATQ